MTEPATGAARWNTLEQWRATSFLVGGAMFIVAAALTMVAIVADAERLSLQVGEAFIAAGWIAALIGLLGLYPGLSDRSRRLARAGGVFAVIGMVTFAVLAVVSLVAFFTGGAIEDFPVVFIIPGVFVGSLLAFVSFSVASLRSDGHSRTIGILLLIPPLIFVTNFFVLPVFLGSGPNPPEVGFVITGGLALAMLTIGYLLQKRGITTNRTESAPTEVRHG